MNKPNACTLGPKHKWAWVKDVTNIKVSITSTATRKTMPRRDIVLRVRRAAAREGAARSGL